MPIQEELPAPLKRCPTCGVIKDIDADFYRNRTGPKAGRILPSCRECTAKGNRARYAANAERRMAYQKAYRAQNAEEVRAHDRERNRASHQKAIAEGRCTWKQGRGCNAPADSGFLMCFDHRELQAAKNAKRYRAVYRASYVERGLTGCWICSGDFTVDDPMQHDHLIPQALGGPDDIWNIAPAHASCNNRRGSLALLDTVARWHPAGLDGSVLTAVNVALSEFAALASQCESAAS